MVEHMYNSQAVRASALTPARTWPQPPSYRQQGLIPLYPISQNSPLVELISSGIFYPQYNMEEILAILSLIKSIREVFSELENNLADGIAATAPWITPLPSAVLVSTAVVQKLHWSSAMGWITALIIESLGFSTVSTSLLLWEYNADKRKIDPKAPFEIAVCLIAIYLVSTISLTILLDIMPELGRYAPAIFPVLSMVSAVNLVLRFGHRKRKSAVSLEKENRKTERQKKQAASVQGFDPSLSKYGSVNIAPDHFLNMARQVRKDNMHTRKDNLLALYRNYPQLGVTEVSSKLNLSRQTIYTYLNQLEDDGRIRRNGNGIEIIEQGELR
jgi:predicted transcriptional regulator